MTSPRAHLPGKNLALVGAILQLAAVLGIASSVAAVLRAVEVSGSLASVFGSVLGDPSRQTVEIGETLIPALFGIFLGLAGCVLLLLALFKFHYRAPWLFWFLAIYGSVLILTFPWGTPFGFFFLTFALSRRGEFLRPCAPALEA